MPLSHSARTQLSLGFSVSVLISSLGLPSVLLNGTRVSMSDIEMGNDKPAQVAFYQSNLGSWVSLDQHM